MASAVSERERYSAITSELRRDRRSASNMALASSSPGVQEGAVPLINVPHVVTLSGARVVLWDSAKRRADKLAVEHIQTLVSLLVVGSDKQREDVAAILANAACDTTNRQEIARVGAIPMLVTALASATPMQPKPQPFVVKITRALANLAWQNDANRRQIEASGGVDTLIEVLNGRAGDDLDIYQEAATALSHLLECVNIASRMDVEKSGVKLNGLAQNGTELQSGLATMLLAKIACHTAKHEHVQELADVPALVAMLTDGSSVSDHSKRAVEVLRQLSRDVQYKSEIVVAGGLEPLIALLSTGCEKQRVDAAWTLGHLAWNAFSEGQIANAGALPPLVALLQSENVREREGAVWALRHLSCTSDNRSCLSALSGAIASLVQCVWSAGSDCEREHAIATLKNLACLADNQSPIASAGAIPVLVSVLSRGTPGQINQATGALRNLVRQSAKNQALLCHAGGIRPLVVVLSTGTETQKVHAAAALANVASSAENQSEIVAEGVLAPLLTLTESQHTPLLEQVVLLLRNLIWRNEKCQARIGASGVIQRMVVMMQQSDSDFLKKQATAVLRNLAWHSPANQERIVDAHAVEPLVTLLANGTSGQREHAAGAIANLMWNSPTIQSQVARANGIAPLADLTGRGNEKLQKQATLAIRQFVFGDNKKVQAAAPGAIPGFVRLQRTSATPSQQQQSTWALANLACNAANKAEIVTAGGIRPLVGVLSTGSSSQRQYAASALANLASTTEHKAKILADGGIPPLIELVNRGSDGQKKQAAWALRNLAWSYVDGQKEIADAGGIPALVHLVVAGSDPQKEHAAAALANLTCAEANQDPIGEAGGIEALVKLATRGTDAQKQQAVLAMANLAMSPSNRAAIIDAGGVLVLQNLAAIGTQDQQRGASAALARINDPGRYSYVTSESHAVFRAPSDGSEDSDYQRRTYGAAGTRASESRSSPAAPKEIKLGRGLYRSVAGVPEIITRSPPPASTSHMEKPIDRTPMERMLPSGGSASSRHTHSHDHAHPHQHHRLHLLPTVRESGGAPTQPAQRSEMHEWSQHDRDHLPPESVPLRRVQSAASPPVRVAYRMPPSPVEQTRVNRPMLHRPSTLGDLLDPYGGYSPATNPIVRRTVPKVKSDVDVIRSPLPPPTLRDSNEMENVPVNSQVAPMPAGQRAQEHEEKGTSRIIDLGSLKEGLPASEIKRRSSGRPVSMDRFLDHPVHYDGHFTGGDTHSAIGHEDVYEFDEDEDLGPSHVSETNKSKYPIISL